MATREIQEERIRPLNEKGVKDGDYALYWMQQSQRAEYNHALEYAVQKANELGQPLLVISGLMDDYPSANARHYAFMLEGLKDAGETLRERGSSSPGGAVEERSVLRPVTYHLEHIVPALPGGGCPEEFPVEEDGGCRR